MSYIWLVGQSVNAAGELGGLVIHPGAHPHRGRRALHRIGRPPVLPARQ